MPHSDKPPISPKTLEAMRAIANLPDDLPPPPGRKLHIECDPPEGYVSVFSNIGVAGINYENRAPSVLRYFEGTDHSLDLVKDPENPYDPNAIRVYAVWQETDGPHREWVGFVPAETAAQMRDEPERQWAAVPYNFLFATSKYGPKIYFDIYGTPRPRKHRSKKL